MRKRIRALLAHRQTVGRVGGFAVTVAFALYNGILGAIYASVWHGSICLYYLLLSALRGFCCRRSAVRRANGGRFGARRCCCRCWTFP